MMYVKSDDDIRRYIVEGSPEKSEPAGHNDEAGQHSHDHDSVAISMPAYGDVVSDRDLDDLVASSKCLQEWSLPNEARRRGRGTTWRVNGGAFPATGRQDPEAYRTPARSPDSYRAGMEPISGTWFGIEASSTLGSAKARFHVCRAT
jgi:hypothetical protein